MHHTISIVYHYIPVNKKNKLGICFFEVISIYITDIYPSLNILKYNV